MFPIAKSILSNLTSIARLDADSLSPQAARGSANMRMHTIMAPALIRWAMQRSAPPGASAGFKDPSHVFLPWGDLAGSSLIPQVVLTDTSEWDLRNVTLAQEQD